MPAADTDLDPVDGLDQRAWAAAGFTITQMNTWGDHFQHPLEALPYLRAGVDPVVAYRWHQEFQGFYPRLAIAGIQAGWTPGEASLVLTGTVGSAALAALHADRVGPYPDAAETVAVRLAGLDLTAGDAVACLDARLTLDEIETGLLDGTLDLVAVRTLSALVDPPTLD